MRMWSKCLQLLSLCAVSSFAFAGTQLDMTPGVTGISQEIYGLHRLMFYWCIAIGVAVFGVMFYSIFKHRKSVGHKPAHFHESTTVEIIWTIIPFLILIGMAIPATKTLMAMSDTSASALTVKVTGSQWKWHYDYLDYEGNTKLNLGFLSVLSTPREQFETPLRKAGLFPSGLAASDTAKTAPNKDEHYLLEVDRPLVIPTGKKVRLLLTADDVIHAWWVPALGIKRDAIPGFINEVWTLIPEGKEGIYRGQCAELCGKDHGFMPIVVDAKSPADFNQWLKDQQVAQQKAAAEEANSTTAVLTKEELMSLGEKEYLASCAGCHQPGGTGLPPMFPALKGSKVATGPAAEHIEVVLNGRNQMPKFKGVLSPKVLAAIITYERNAWGNNKGDLVQPSDIAAHK